MTNTVIRIAILGVSFYLVTAATSAEAAKGVKKAVPGNARHTISGVVTSITPDKTGYGTFQVRTAQHHKKVGVANAGANGGNGTQHVHVTAATRIEHHNGSAVSTVNVAALQKGQHVRVTSTGQQAQSVQIITHNRYRGSYTRHRASNYHPHYAHHSNHGGGHHAHRRR